MNIPIKNRSRKYGYVFWVKSQDDEMKRLLTATALTIPVTLNKMFLGEKSIDWKFRRISIGYKFTRSLAPQLTTFHLKMKRDRTLTIETM